MADKQSIACTRFPLFFLTNRSSLGRRSEKPLWDFVVNSLKQMMISHVITELRGDWKYLVDLLGITRTYSSRNICFRCGATQANGAMPHSEFGMQASWLQTIRTNVQFLTECLPELDAPSINPLLYLPGFHVDWLRPCWMHTTHLGVGLFTNGSAIRVLLDANFCPGNSKEECLQNLWQKFRRWRAQHKIYTSMPRFRHYLLKEDGQHVFYHTKAWHGRILTAFLTDQLQLASSQSQDRNLALVADCVWHLAETYHAVEHAPRFLSGPDPWRRKVPDNINFCIFFNLFLNYLGPKSYYNFL